MDIVVDDEVTVDCAALGTVLAAAGLGELTATLAPLATWTPPAERGEGVAAAWQELERAGLARHGGLEARVADWLRLLASAGEERYAWSSGPGEAVNGSRKLTPFGSAKVDPCAGSDSAGRVGGVAGCEVAGVSRCWSGPW